MSLLFGYLIQDFVNFGTAIQNIDPNDPQSFMDVDEAAKRFRHVAAQDASYLVCIGT
jgi:ATP-binding cassette subfamily B (MDR/TAP) protein 1